MLAFLVAGAALTAGAAELAAGVRTLLPELRAAGAGRLTWFGFEAYDARLWVAPGFRASEFQRHGFALELAYLRDFRARAIAERSLVEMRRAAPITAEESGRWTDQIAAALPDVKSGDRITGVHRPGVGTAFFVNERAAGRIDDPRFSQLFFGIWLGPQSSEPALRDALLSGTAR